MNKEFDKFSSNYSEILNKNLNDYSEYSGDYYQEYKVKILAEQEKSCEKILDFGCGTGVGCKFLKKYFPNSEITGIDMSKECLNEAKKISDIEFLDYDGEKIPFEENSFDVIYSSCVFHHIKKENRQNLLNQLNSILKPNGKIYIFEHNPINPITRKIVKECIFDKNAELVFPKEFYKAEINYTLFVPRFKLFKHLFWIDKYLNKLPIGAQYYAKICKQK